MWLVQTYSSLTQVVLLTFFANTSFSLLSELEAEKVLTKHENQRRTEGITRANDIISLDDHSSSLGDFDADYMDYLEDRWKEGVDSIPTHEFQDDNDGDTVDRKRPSSANYIDLFSATSAKIGAFSSLDCNTQPWSDCSTLVSNKLPSGNDPLTIPCGQCYTFDVGGNVTLNGLNIEGKLMFPLNHKAVISTPYVIVQGELEITVDHAKIAPENIGTKFILTETNAIYFKPTKTPNQNACDGSGGSCNLGAKPFVVAGGKVSINAMPETCASHTPIIEKIYTDPEYDYEDFPHFVELPEECPQSGLSFISYNFDDGNYGNWTGRDGAFMEVMDDGSVKVINRKIKSRGPHLDITPLRPDLCLVPDQDYLFVARIKLDKADGSMVGKDSTCKESGQFCPELRVAHYDADVDRDYSHRKTDFHYDRNRAPVYGEYFYFNAVVTFQIDELYPENGYTNIRIEGPEKGIDITIDSFDLFLPDETSYPDPNDLCYDLILNGDAEANGFHPYPMYSAYSNNQLIKVEENGNKFWRLFDRNYYKSSISYDLNDICLTQGLTYLFSSKVRFHHSKDFVGGSEPYVWYIDFKRISDGKWIERDIVECAAQSVKDGWVTCSGDFMIDKEMAEASELQVKMRFKNSRDGDKYNLDFDDIFIRYHKGYVSELVVDNQDVSCWGNDVDIHVTTSTYYNHDSRKPPGLQSQIISLVNNGDGTATLELSEAATLPIISSEENSDYAAEIALLSRNVIIKGDEGEDNKGGYMQVLHTSNLAQNIQGVEFQNMGRRGEVDRYALQFVYSGNVEGTLISRNSFRQSNQRCVVIEGTSNITISHNIGYETRGHCIYIGFESTSNLITKNLVSDTKHITYRAKLSGETDYSPCAYLNQYHPNNYISNIAVAGESHGYCFSSSSLTRLENGKYANPSVRKLKLGAFEKNSAKSFYSHGFYFAHHESQEEIFIVEAKAIKNRYIGIYIYYSYDVTIRNSLFAENVDCGVNAKWTDKLQIQDSVIKGITSETKALVKPPYFRKPCVSSSFTFSPTGLTLPTYIRSWNRKDNIGANLTNVRFMDFDHSDECATSYPLRFRAEENRYNHFEHTTIFRNVTIDGGKIMDALSSDKEGVKDIAIHDVDGSSDPLGKAANGMLVSNVKSLTTFANNSCVKYPEGASYCADTCYRTVSFFVDQSDSQKFDLSVTRKTDGEKAIVPFTYKYDDDSHRKHYYENYRAFSVSLPIGAYKIEFLKDLQPTWPTFVLPRWEGTPECEGYVFAENITVVETYRTCDELIVNGDMDQGVYHWYHRNNRGTERGILAATIEEDGSTGLKHYNRYSSSSGIGQNLDTRCLHQSLNEFYEMSVYYRLEHNNSTFKCDIFSDSSDLRCPYITFRQERYVNEKMEKIYVSKRANVVFPNDLDGFNLMHGVFKVDESIQVLERLFMYVEGAHKDYDMIINKVSVRKLPGICGDDLIRNGNFEQNGKFWQRYGNVHLDIESLPNKNLKVSKKSSSREGVQQELFIDKLCFKSKQRFHVTAKFKLEVASTGAPFRCDRNVYGGELECGRAYIKSYLSGERYDVHWDNPVAIATDQYQGWDMLSGIWTVNEKQNPHDIIILRLYNQHKNNNVFYDDVKIVPLSESCDRLVLNSDFEEGDSNFWQASRKGSINIDISTLGAGASSYSLMTNKYTSNRVYQDLDTRCIIEDQEFLISAKFRLLNATDLVSGVKCSPSVKNKHDKNHCPTVAIYGSKCAVNDIRFYFFNEIDHIQWDPNGFNDFEKVFPITADLASCEIVRVEVGHYVHNGRILLVDDIQISQRTTSPPTMSPTFSPTEGKNTGPTNQPTIKTDSPTTTNLITCPSVGDAPLAVGSGSVMLSVAKNALLCTLTKSVTSSVSGETILIPVARSYDKNRWEQAAGEQAASILGGKDILCYSVGCQLELQGHGTSEQYLLSSSSYSLSESNEYARFLETSTFGITQADLDSFDASPNSVQDDIIDWISIQMNVSKTPLSSHRKYWRSRINSRLPTSTNIGTPDHPCDKYSRWRRVSFIRNDHKWEFVQKLLVVNLGSTSAGPFKLELNRWPRTVVDTFEIVSDGYSNYTFDPTYEYELCRSPEDYISNGRLYIRLEPKNEDRGPCVIVTNPLLNLDGYESTLSNIFNLPNDSLKVIDQQWNSDEELVFQLQTSLFDKPSFSTICARLPPVPEFGDEPVFGKLSDGTWLIFDPRLDLMTNTLTSPQQDGGKNDLQVSGGDTLCSNVPRTFLNEDQCQVSSDACRPSANSQVNILLDNTTIAALNNLTGRYTYAIKGLLVKYDGMALDHPCTPGLRSRWERKNTTECSLTDLYGNTTVSLTDLLLESGDRNPYIRDITFPNEGKICEASDTEPEIEIEVDGLCWKRVHDNHMSIFDMTYWVDRHPGGAYNIQKWVINNRTMANWNNNWHKFTYVGRFGDYLKLGDLPNDLRSDEVTNYFEPSDEGDNSKILVCGSPGEVSSNRDQGFFFDVDNDFSTVGLHVGHNRKYIWTMVALSASDQLRQRVAWALSQILVVVKNAIGSQDGKAEWFLVYYDIFVRNAFSNYRDVLKEVSYNPLMAENLSFLRSKSAAYMLERYQVQTSADENFAREIMQLFTIGLTQLNVDGSQKLDSNGNTILSYTNDDIMSFSRAWTGFDLQSRRGNMEGEDNRIDPMKIIPEWRDRFPKSDTTGGYIGDTYPMCNDSPSRSFLRRGATFRFLGSSSLPELMTDPADFATQETVTRVVLDNSSSLRKLLCDEDLAGVCVFKNSITLLDNYDCTGIECEVDTIRVVQVDVNSFYEYVPEPCINLIFYNNPVKISPYYSTNKVMCADPKLAVASEACCSLGDPYATRNSKYSGERMTFETAKTRCKDTSKSTCDFYRVEGEKYLNFGYFWTSDSCLLQVKVERDGRVAIVHRPSDFLERVVHVVDDNQNYFRVYWSREGDYPSVDNDCDNVCEVLEEGSCLCNTGVIERAVFNGMPSSKDEALEKLSIGAFNPRIFDSETYSSLYDEDKQITAHLIDNVFNSETIFEFDDENGRSYFMKNIDSSVYLRGIESGYTGQSFRNPPQFMSFIPTETNLRDAQYETEATLDHYFFHDNTAPFIATRLIQRLTTSNPTPRYIETVSNAFKSGSYATGGTSFGSGKYGDLAATIAAIYLDSAARNVLLDEDISSGSLREPILKVMSVLRSMEFESKFPVTVMHDLFESVGQMAHEFTTVFSFFLPEFTPYGRVGDASLVSPESTLLDMPKIIGLMNGLTSLAKYGLSSCEGGWGGRRCEDRIYAPSVDGVLEFNKIFVKKEFSFETFEGPSLKGGLDNTWVGRYYGENYGVTTVDPLDNINHVVHFPRTSRSGYFFSQSIANEDEIGDSYVVKFRYLGNAANSGGCIGYVDATKLDLNTQTWALCDKYRSIMESEGLWQSCQFIIPAEIESFHIVVGDVTSPGGDAYFDDIQLATGNETTCTGVNVPKKNPLGQAGYSTLVVDKLSTLLTAGRLSSESKAVITDAFDNAGSAKDGLRVAQQLIFSTGEFHTTNIVKSTDQPRENVSFEEPTGEPYRAVIFLMLSGGCDSFNMLVPYTCSNDLYESYLDVRQQVAIPKNRLLPISASDQVCSVFGLHPELSAIQSLYDDGDLLFFANTGVLSRPVNKDNYNRLTNVQLFAHNHMQRATQRIDPYKHISGTGVLGRISDILNRKGRNVGSFSVDRFSVALVGQPGVSNSPFIVDRNGVPQAYLDDILMDLDKLHNVSHAESGIFADSWSSSLMESIGVNQLLSAGLANVTVNTEFPHSYLGYSLKTVSRLIATKDLRGVDVDTFYVEMGGFDTHSDVEEALNYLFHAINGAVYSFSEEMKSRDLWDNVTIIQASDFARTLNPNGGDGTDHAWGGNYMMMGGSVKGGQILGEYPEDITEEGPWTLRRGRMIPTTPWEVPFHAIARWLGIESSSDMEEVCPNLRNFDSISLDDPELILSNSLTIPTMSPTSSSNPTIATSTSPSSLPTSIPSIEPSDSPTSFYWPSKTPSQSVMPSALSSFPPSDFPSTKASSTPSAWPSNIPSKLLSSEPNSTPSAMPSVAPSSFTSLAPSINPSSIPSNVPSFKPSVVSSLKPTELASSKPSDKPSKEPSASPSVSKRPSEVPSVAPSSCPSDCYGDAETNWFSIAGQSKRRKCSWASNPKHKEKRCQMPEVALNCCKTCCASCVGDAAGKDNFIIYNPKREVNCAWVAEDAHRWCAEDSVAIKCCKTCSDALATSYPSSVPSFAPTDCDDRTDNFIPSNDGLKGCSYVNQIPEGCKVYASDCPQSCGLCPSLAPSVMPSLLPSSAPSGKIENVALQKPTSQSSDARNAPSSKAVDGYLVTMSRTKWEQDPHWHVDLEGDYEIKVIKLHLNGQRLSRMKQFRLKILDGEVEVWKYQYPGVPTSSSIVIDVPETTVVGNKVQIALKGRNKALELREVEVMAISQ